MALPTVIRLGPLGLSLIAGAAVAVGACAPLAPEPLQHAEPAGRGRDGATPLISLAGADEGVAFDDDDCAPAPLGAPYPIILVHGFSGWMDFGGVEYFYNVPETLRAAGHDVTAPALPPYDGSDERARVLAAIVDDVLLRTNKQKVHLIAHSQGGVDSRLLVTELGYADRVA